MNINDVKKELYKTKQTAYFQFIRKGSAYYETLSPKYLFIIPVNDMGDADYMPEMQAQHLIRYLSVI